MLKKLFKEHYISIISLLLIIPLIIFFLFFTKLYISIPAILIIIICFRRLVINEKQKVTEKIKTKKNYYLTVTLILLVWNIFSGIGSFSFQNKDFDVRNAVLRDLINYDWPIVYDFSKVEKDIKEIIGENQAGFVYYYAYWLPSAIVGKLFGELGANIFLVIWTLVFQLAIIFLINTYFKKQSYTHLFFLIFFSGLDYLGCMGESTILDVTQLEWWNAYFQYSANTTQLYWVFNQSIPVWLITILLLNLKKENSILFIAPLIFCYSPFATFGMVPIAIYLLLKNIKKQPKKMAYLMQIFLSPESILAFIILIVYGSFYLSASSSISFNGIIWKLFGMSFISFLPIYITFIFVEVLMYFILLFKSNKKDGLFILIVIELLLIPMYQMTPANDFCMRGSISPLFILMLYWIKFIENIKKQPKYIMILSYIIIIFGMITPIREISRSIYNTFTLQRSDYIKDKKIYSIGNPITIDGAELCNEQFYNKNIKETFYGKYISK